MRSTPLLTVRQVADRIGMSTEFVRREIDRGRLAAKVTLKLSGGRTHRKISEQDLRSYLEVWGDGARIGA